MRCPLCFEKIPRYSDMCLACGFHKSELENTSNALTIEMKKKDPEMIIESNIVPKDLSKKKLLLFAIFTGIFGGHLFYCRRYVKAIINAVSMTLLICATPFVYGDLPLPVWFNTETLITIAGVPAALVVVSWIVDIIAILLGKFKIPVVILNRV